MGEGGGEVKEIRGEMGKIKGKYVWERGGGGGGGRGNDK